jgi:hypothetical protein
MSHVETVANVVRDEDRDPRVNAEGADPLSGHIPDP